MKKINKHAIWMITLILPFLLIMCMTIEKITHPENAQVNSEIEIGVDIKLVAENDDNTKFIFAVLAPKDWNIADNAQLTFTTNGYYAGDVVDEQMQLTPDTDTETTTAMSWPDALQSEIGVMNNFGPMEWVVFESQTIFDIADETNGEGNPITADINIRLTTGSKKLKANMGYFMCGKNRGMHEEYYSENARSKVLEVTGGDGAIEDYTTPNLVSTVPSTFGWGDVFSVEFETEAGDVVTELKGADKVYMLGRIIYNNDQDTCFVEEKNEKTLMEDITEGDGLTWQKYLYATDYFEDLPDDAEITKAEFYFTDADAQRAPAESGDYFVITETCGN